MSRLPLNTLRALYKAGKLTVDWPHWADYGAYMLTNAHVAARYNLLPVGFERYDLKSKTKWSVAHAAALHGNLPANTGCEHLICDAGETVQQIYNIVAQYARLYKIRPNQVYRHHSKTTRYFRRGSRIYYTLKLAVDSAVV